jgi:hypothetical protein
MLVDPETHAAEARDALSAARASRAALVAKAATGKPVAVEELLAASAALKRAEAAHELAAEVTKAAAADRQRAELAELTLAAAGLATDRDAVLSDVAEAAAFADLAVQHARDSMAHLGNMVARLDPLAQRVASHTHAVEEAARRNPTLAEMHRSVWPLPPKVPDLHGMYHLEVAVLRPAALPAGSGENRTEARPLAALVEAWRGR